MSDGILTAEEFSKIETLNTVQIIKSYPELVIKASKDAKSLAEMLSALGISVNNDRARKNIRAFMEAQGLEVPNYRLYQYTSEYSVKASMSKEEVLTKLVKGGTHLGTALRRFILKYDILPYRCATPDCTLSQEGSIFWNGKSLKLDLDHIDGDNTNNELSNLRWLCPNCHSQTETYKGRNKRIANKPILEKERAARRKAFAALPDANLLWAEIKKDNFSVVAARYGVKTYDLKIKLVEYTGDDPTVIGIVSKIRDSNERLTDTGKRNRFNLTGEHLQSKSDSYPPVEDMVARIESEGYEALAREIGVSGNGIRKYLKNRLGYTPKRVRKGGSVA